MIIYKTTNLINGKIYIGQDKKNNPSYYGSGLKLIKAIKKYGRENFKKDILEECTDENHMNEREGYWIKYHNSTDRKIGYNISEGGKEGDRKIGHEIAKNGIYNYWVSKYGEEEAIKRRENQIKKLSDTLKQIGTPLTKKGRYALWVEKYGEEEANRRHLEWRLKISEYQKYKMENGWTHSPEAKEKIRNAFIGKKHSEETKEKMRKPKPKGFSEKLSELKKGVLSGPSKKRKKVEQYDLNGNLIKVWESMLKAESELKIYNIYSVCNGKQETAGGYRWKYKNEEND